MARVFPEVQRIPAVSDDGRPRVEVGPDGSERKVYARRKTGFWVMDYVDEQGIRRRERAGRTKVAAEKALRKKLDEIDKSRLGGIHALQPVLFRDFAEKYIEYATPLKRSWEKDEGMLRNHLVPYFGDTQLHRITVRSVEDYRAKRLTMVKKDANGGDMHFTRSTVNRETALLKRMIGLGIKWRHTEVNPAKDVKLYPEPNGILRYLLPPQLDRLYACCPSYLRPIVQFAANSGMRMGEILDMKWADVLREQGIILLHQTKSGKRREIPLNEPLEDVLQSLTPVLHSPYVFCRTDGERWNHLHAGFKTAKAKAGIDPAFRFHDLRHTFASNAVMAGMDLLTLKEILGHSTLQMVQRYAHLSPGHKAAAMDKVGSRMRGGSGEKTIENGSRRVEDGATVAQTGGTQKAVNVSA